MANPGSHAGVAAAKRSLEGRRVFVSEAWLASVHEQWQVWGWKLHLIRLVRICTNLVRDQSCS